MWILVKWERRKEMRKRNMMRNLFFSTRNLSSDAAKFKQSVSFVWHQKTSLNRLKKAAAKKRLSHNDSKWMENFPFKLNFCSERSQQKFFRSSDEGKKVSELWAYQSNSMDSPVLEPSSKKNLPTLDNRLSRRTQHISSCGEGRTNIILMGETSQLNSTSRKKW